MALVTAVGCAADAVDVLRSKLQAVVAVGDQLVALVVVRKARAVRGAGDDGGARLGLLGCDANARLVGEGRACLDRDDAFAGKVDVVGRGAHLVFADGNVAGNGEGAGVKNTAASDVGAVVGDAAAGHGEGAVVAHAAAPKSGVIRNAAAAHGKGGVEHVVDGRAEI